MVEEKEEKEEKGKNKLSLFSVKIPYEVRSVLMEIKDDDDFKTWGQLFEKLVDSYYSPQKVKKENVEKIQELNKEIERLKGVIESSSSEKNIELETLKQENQKLDVKNEYLQKELETLQNKDVLMPNQHIIELDKLNYRVLQYVAEVEGNRRKQQWTVDDVINYFIEHLLIKGVINGGLKAPSDSVINELRKDIEL